MPIQSYLSILRRRWWLLVLGPALAGICAFLVSQQLTPVYRAQAQLLVVNQTRPGEQAQLNDLLTNEQVTKTYVLLIQRREILQRAIDSLRLPMTVDQLAAKIDVSLVPDTQLINIGVRDSNAARTASIANLIARDFIADIDKQLGRAGTVTVAEAAVTPDTPVSPNIRQNLLVALVLGMALSVGMVAVLELHDDTLKSAEDLRALGVRPLGAISRFKNRVRRRGGSPGTDRRTAAAIEDFRALRTNVRFADADVPMKTFVVTSYRSGEGKSTIAANLASALAQADERVILVDTDLRRPTLHDFFGLENRVGLSHLLTHEGVEPQDVLYETSVANLRLLPAGTPTSNPSELLTSRRMRLVTELLSADADVVIFDSPALNEVSDGAVLAAQVDQVLMVVEPGKTRIPSIEEMLVAFAAVNGRVLGAVLNKHRKGPTRSRELVGQVGDVITPTRGRKEMPSKPRPKPVSVKPLIEDGFAGSPNTPLQYTRKVQNT